MKDLDLIFYDSPLKKAKGKIILVLILMVIVFFAGNIWKGWLTPLSNIWIMLPGIFIGCIGSVIGLLLLRYLDRREPEPLKLWFGILLFALLFTTASAAYVNTNNPYTLFTVGINEEFWKVLPLLMLAYFAPRVVNGVRDGIIYGALGGFAFNIIELSVYFLRESYPHSGYAGLIDQVGRLGFWGIENHVIWSMLVGAGIGKAIESKSLKVKILAPLGAYLLAAFTHTLQDVGIGPILTVFSSMFIMKLHGLDTSSLASPEAQAMMKGSLDDALRIETLMINVIIIPILLVQLLKSGNKERQTIKDELADEVGGAITAEEYQGVLEEKRFRLRKIHGYPKKVAKKIRNLQNSLAFHKDYLKNKNQSLENDPVREYYIQEIAKLRTQK